jgi:pimeloyl-ACP methyl ester carboxylesterase
MGRVNVRGAIEERMTIRRRVEVAGLVATVVEPEAGANGRVVYCLPGGGMSRRYFDLHLAGYSMAEHLAAQGFIVVAIDHPGVGDSPAPDDAWMLVPSVVADADAAAIAELDAALGGIPIGVGHSMGAMLTVTLQARHRRFAGLGLLGYAHSDHYEQTALAAHLTDAELAIVARPDLIEDQLVELARARFGGPLRKATTTRSAFLLGGMEVPEAALAAIDASASNLLTCCGLASMLKCTADAVTRLDVPIFLGFGECDITGNARATAGLLRTCPDITLFELPGAGHNHNVAPNRAQLWDRLGQWALGVPNIHQQ